MSDFSKLIPQRRGKGRLEPPATRSAIAPSVASALPAGDPAVGGNTGTPTLTAYSLTSSDGLFVLAGFKATDGDFYVEEPP